MTEKIVDGDYVKDGAGLAEVQYIEELLQNAVIALQTLRGSFYPDKNFGSQLRSAKDMSEALVIGCARQALSGFDGVHIKAVKIGDDGCAFTLSVNDQERQVLVKA